MIDITSDDILGKLGIDLHGDIVGTITQLHINKSKKTITGITIDQGFMKPDLFIGIDHITNFGIDSVFLNLIPFENIKGKNILSNNGEKVAIVQNISIKHHKLHSITASKGKFSNKKIIIPANHVKEIANDIILKEKYDNIWQTKQKITEY